MYVSIHGMTGIPRDLLDCLVFFAFESIAPILSKGNIFSGYYILYEPSAEVVTVMSACLYADFG